MIRLPCSHHSQEAHLSAGNGVQIIGKVNPDLSIKVLSSIDLGTGVGESPAIIPIFSGAVDRGEVRWSRQKVTRLSHPSLAGHSRPSAITIRWRCGVLTISADYNLANTVVEISHQHRNLFAYD